MVKPEVIRRRLEKLDEYLAFLEKVKEYSEPEFLGKTEIWAGSERFLQNHLVAIHKIRKIFAQFL